MKKKSGVSNARTGIVAGENDSIQVICLDGIPEKFDRAIARLRKIADRLIKKAGGSAFGHLNIRFRLERADQKQDIKLAASLMEIRDEIIESLCVFLGIKQPSPGFARG